MHGFFRMGISNKKMAQVMYAILKTQSKLVSSHCVGLDLYTDRHVRGFLVSVVVEVDDHKVSQFEELAEVKLQTSEEFQGKVVLNSGTSVPE